MNFKKILSLKVLLLLICTISNAQPGTSWSHTGPIAFPINATGQINGIGRVSQLKFHATDPKKMYAVSASGGLWISADSASTWVKTGTDQLAQGSCASVCIDYTNDNIIYLGTGDANYYNTDFGIWKSIDGGQTWAQSTTGMGNRLAIEILMDPANNNILVAATDNGIYRSTNAGANWTQVKTGGSFYDMAFKAGSTTTLFAVTDSQFWRSTDFGTTWTQTTTGVVVPGGGSGGGMRIAVSAANPNTLYIGMVKDGGTVFKSTDGGTSFTQVYHNTSQLLTGYDAVTAGQGNYDFAMCGDPTNANTVFVIAHCVWRSTDAGVNWTKLTSWAQQLHTDHHGIGFHPTYPNKLYNVNDGGVWVSNDKGDNWMQKSEKLGATEIYHAAQSPIKRDMVCIGTQDNGELYFTANQWTTNRGGDWSPYLFCDYSVNNRVYYHENGKRRLVTGAETSFNPPFTPANSTNLLLEFTRKMTGLAFIGGTNVWRTTTLNNATPAWTQILSVSQTIKAMNSSPADSTLLYVVTSGSKIYRSDNALVATPTFTNYNTPASTSVMASVAGIKSDKNIVYMSCGNKVYRSANKGATWTDISANLPAVNIIKIYHDEYSTNETIYLASARGVYYKTASMTNWTNISYNMPSIVDIRDLMYYNTGTSTSLLRVSTWGRGVWEMSLNASGPPNANFAASTTTICSGTAVTFNDQSINAPTSWSWSFPGGTPSSSTLQNPSITYGAGGTYTVTLQSANANGTSTPISKTITVNATPTVAVSNATICSGSPATISASGATTYNWNTGATTPSISVTPTITTNYTVTGTSLGCNNTKTVSVTVKATPTVAVSNATICSGNTTTLSASGATTYSWNTGATTTSITVTPTITTNYTIAGTTNGCTNTKTLSVTVKATPTVAVSNATVCLGNATTLSAGGATTYSWNTGATTSSISVTPTVATNYTVTGTTNGCINTKTVSVTVNATPTVAVGSATICSGATATLTASGSTATYSWNTGATGANATMSPTVNTNYTVTATGANGCIKTATATVVVGSAPVITVNSATICSGTTATLNASGVTTYTWNTSSNSTSITVNPMSTTVYTVSGKLTGCTVTAITTATVTVKATPSVTLGTITSPLCVNSTTVALSGNPGGGIFSGPGVTGSTFNPATSGAGTFTINYNYTAPNNCSNSANQSVVISLCTNILEFNGSFATVFPNPMKNEITINLDNDLVNNSTIELFDAAGKLVMSEKMGSNTNTFQVTHLASGIYSLRITTKNTQKSLSIIKE